MQIFDMCYSNWEFFVIFNTTTVVEPEFEQICWERLKIKCIISKRMRSTELASSSPIEWKESRVFLPDRKSYS